MKLFRTPWFPFVALGALCVFHVLVNVWWLRVDNHVVRVDEESHMEYARAYYEVFALNTYSSLVEQVVAIGNIRPKTMSHPPLLHAAGGLQMGVFGYSVDVLLFTNTYSFVLCILGVYLLARRVLSRWESVFAAAVFSCAPMAAAGSRFFMTDYLSMAVVLWGVYALLQSKGFKNTGWVLLFAVLNGLGLLCRSVNFLYLLGPAMVVYGAGLWGCVTWEARLRRLDVRALRRLLVHAAMVVVVTFGIASPWYFRHAESIFDYWVTFRSTVTGSPLAGLDAAQMPEEPSAPAPADAHPKPAPTPASEARPSAPPEPAPVVSSPGFLARVMNRVLYPPNAWVNYPVHVINNVLFLPLTLLALLGMLCAPAAARFRRLDVLVYLAWIFGSWFFLQMTLRWSTPRYALQVLPAFTLFAALAVLALPRGKLRLGAMAVVGAFLCLQFINLTFVPLGPLHRIEAPVVLSKPVQEKYNDPGLVVWKEALSASNAFRHMGVPEQRNYKDEIFRALVRAETTGPPKSGEFANYARLNMYGMEWDEKHYWPEPNPYLDPRLAGGPIPARKLRTTALAPRPNLLRDFLPSVDYVVYRALSERQKQEWVDYFSKFDFALIAQYNEPTIGADPAAWYGVLEKGGTPLDLTTQASVITLDIYDLHSLINTAAFAQADAAVRRAAEQRYKALLAELKPVELTTQVSLLKADIARSGSGFQMRYLLQINKAIEREVGMYLVGRVGPEHYGLLPPEAQGKRDYFLWHLQPSPPSTAWQPGTVQLITHDFQPAPVPHALIMGLESFSGDLIGAGANLGMADFGALAAAS